MFVSSEFQPQETGYMFGSSDRPENDEDRDEYQGHDIGDAVNAVIRRPHRQDHSGDADAGDGAAAWRLKFWQRQQNPPSTPTNAGNDGGGHLRRQTSFGRFYKRNKKSGVNLEATLDEQLANELEEGVADDRRGAGAHRRAATSAATSRPPRLPARGGRSAAPRKSPVRPAGVPADAADGGVVDLGDLKGGKLKAAVKRAMAAQRREKEAAARRGRQKKREAQELGEFQGFIQVRDPALDKVCLEYGLTADLAEAKYR